MKYILLALFVFNFAHASVLSPTETQKKRAFVEALRYRGMRPMATDAGSVSTTHLQFENQAEALKWAKDNSQYFQSAFEAKTWQVLDTDARYAPLQQYVHDLWVAYSQLYPNLTAGLNEPPVVLVQTEAVNAFVPNDTHSHRIAHVVVVLTQILDNGGGVENRDAISGIMGHELSHSIFRHGLSEYAALINKFFDPNVSAMGYQAPRNLSLESQMQKWLTASEFAGDLSLSEIFDLPSPSIGKGIGTKVLNQIASEFFSGSAECTSASGDYRTWTGFFQRSAIDQEISLDPSLLPALKLTSQVTVQAAETCLGTRRKPFIDLLAKVLSVSPDELKKSTEILNIADQFDKAPNMIEGLRGVIRPPRQTMAAVEAAVNLSQLGYYTYEENADDHSSIVHAYLGLNPNALGVGLDVLFSPEQAKECRALIAKGTNLKGGAFTDMHRATCFRIDHIQRLAKTFPGSKAEMAAFAANYEAGVAK